VLCGGRALCCKTWTDLRDGRMRVDGSIGRALCRSERIVDHARARVVRSSAFTAHAQVCIITGGPPGVRVVTV
jgi:hypothetical protein